MVAGVLITFEFGLDCADDDDAVGPVLGVILMRPFRPYRQVSGS
jgi:hypothetical protein